MKKKITCMAISTLVWLFLFSSAEFCMAEELQYEETQRLVSLVDDATALVEEKGEHAFKDFSTVGSCWRHFQTYILVVGLDGTFIVHPDPNLVGKNQIDLKDVNGKPIVRWFIAEVSGEKRSGWSHYLWAKPNHIFPTWKTTYVKLAKAPSGKEYIIASGAYDIKMEKAFIVDVVNEAIDLIKKEGIAAFSALRDKTSEFINKDTYVFVIDNKGTLLVDPPFPSLEGQNMYNYTDAFGKYMFREFIQVANSKGSGWVDYMWPRPGDSKALKKSSFIKRITVGDDVYIVGAGMYLE